MVTLPGQAEKECRALAELAFQPYLTSVHLDELFRNREPEPCSAVRPSMAPVDLSEALKNKLLVFFGNADAVITYRKQDARRLFFYADFDFTALWREFERIAE